LEALENIVSRATADFGAAGDPASLENAKARYLGKSGELSGFRATLGSLSPEERRVAGAAFNAAKERI
jgi:phenylalanyl-tRNA synthetase alpha chain